MSRIPFVKAHACGNDFLIIEESLAQNRHAALARKLCSRNTGIGADGIEFLDRTKPNDPGIQSASSSSASSMPTAPKPNSPATAPAASPPGSPPAKASSM